MPNWKKVVTSGSNAHLNSITTQGNITASGYISGKLVIPYNHGVYAQDSNGNTNNSVIANLMDAGLVFGDATTVNTKLQGINTEVEGSSFVLVDSPQIKLGQSTAQHVTASGNISASGILYGSSAAIVNTLYLGGENRIDYNNDDVRLLDTGLYVAGGHITASSNISASGTIQALDMRVGTSGQPNGIIRFGVPGDKTFPQIIQSEVNQLKLERGNGATLVKYNFEQHSDGPKVIVIGDISASGTTYSLFNTAPQAHFGNSAPIPSDYQLQVTGDTFLNGDLYTNSNITASGNISSSATSTVQAGSGSFHVLKGDTTQATSLEVNGPITASGGIISDNIETFWTSFNCDGDGNFGSSMYGPNTHGINYYHWNKNWSTTTSDSGNPTGDHVHRSEINSGWYVPYKLKIVELCGGLHDGNSSSTVACEVGLWNTAASLASSNYDSNTATTKEFIVSGSVTLNGNRWKHYSQTCDVTLEEGQYVLPRVRMGENLTNLRGQFTIKFKRVQ